MPQAKIVNYLLSATHRDGKSKERFFTRFGFSIERWGDLANALLRHAAENQVVNTERSPFGRRYVIDGIMHAVDGRTPRVRCIWFIEEGDDIPQFATAYPLKERK